MVRVFGQLAQPPELFLQLAQIFIGKFLEIDQLIPSAFDGANDLVELEVNCLGVPVLSVLDQKYHQESDDRRSGINDELPGIRIMKGWAGNPPDDDDQQ